MGTAEFVQTGDQIKLTPVADVAAGDVAVFSGGIAVYEAAQTAGRTVGARRKGVFEVPKATGGGTALAVGDEVGWDSTNNRVRALSGADAYAGRIYAAAADADTHVMVDINAPIPGSTA